MGPQRKQERLDELRKTHTNVEEAYSTLMERCSNWTRHNPHYARNAGASMDLVRPLQEALLSHGLNRFDARDLAHFAAAQQFPGRA